MFKLKNLFYGVLLTLLLTSGLAVSASALNVADNIDYGFIQLNGGDLLQSTGTLPQYYASSLADYTAITSYAIYIPLTSDAQSVSVLVNLMTGAVTSYGSATVSYGTIFGQQYSRIGVLPSSKYSRSAAPQEHYSGHGAYKIGNIYTIDTSGINVDRNSMYLCIGFSGCDFNLRPKLYSVSGSTSSGLGTVKSTQPLGILITANQMTSFSYNGGTIFPNASTYGSISFPSDITVKMGSYDLLLASDDISGVSFTYSRSSDDSEAVEQLQQINTTLDGMASNLQLITDDFKARDNVSNDISGTATDTDISSGTSGLSSGSSSISSGISGLPSFGDMMAPCVGYISFLTAPIQMIFNFGNGYLLYIATAMVILSVIFFVIRRMGGSDD